MENRLQEIPLNENKFKKLFNLYFPDLITFLVLLISGIVYIYGIGKFLDIFGNDESMYLYWGISFPYNFPLSEWSPLYIIWYYFLNLLQPDTISLYFLNYILMTILPPLFIYIFLRVNKVQLIISFTCSLLFLLSSSNFPTWPKVSHFALLSLLTGLIISSFLNDKKLKVLVFTLSLLVTSFIRPEFFISYILIGVILFVMYVKEFFDMHTFKSVAPLITAALISLVLLNIFGLPVGSGTRSFEAFGQHYSRNWVKWHNDPRDPYYNYSIILKEDFGNANSVSEAFIKNPSAIIKHVTENLKILPDEFKYMFLYLYPPNYPGKFMVISALVVLIISLIPFSRNLNKLNQKSFLKKISENFKNCRFFFLIVLIALAPLILSSIFVYPRKHYLLFPGVIIILLLIIILFRNIFITKKRFTIISLAYVCILPIMLVRPLSSIVTSPKPENQLTIKFLRSLEIKEPVNILETWGIYSIYESKNYVRVPEYSKDVLFKEYLNKWSINMVVLSERLSNDTRFSTDPEWNYFIKHPEEFGFITIEIPDVKGIKLLVKKDILKEGKKIN